MAQDGATGAMSSEDRLNALEAGAVGTWRWDAAASGVHLSPRACELVGARQAFVPYPEFLALLHPEDRQAFDRSFRGIHVPGAGWEADFRLVPQASVRWRRMRGRADAAGAAFTGVIIDIRAPTDETIVRLAAIAAASDDAIIGTTLDGIIAGGIAAPRQFSVTRRARSSASRFPFFCRPARRRSIAPFSPK